MALILGAILLLLLLLVGRAYISADSRTLAKGVRGAGAALVGLLALFLGVTGRIGAAFFLAAIAYALAMGREMPWGRRASATGASSSSKSGPQATTPNMSRAEALKVLGLKDDAGADDIRAAHRRLILQNHPDKGGSSYLAAKVNQAKDVLLGE